MVPERWQFVEGVREKKMLICSLPLPSAARFAHDPSLLGNQ